MSITLSGLRTSASFAENTVNAAPQLLDDALVVSAQQGGNSVLFLPAATLTVSGLLAEDRVGLLNQGTAAGQVSVSGSNVLVGGGVVGSFSGGVGNSFTVSFGSNIFVTTIDFVAQALTYANTSNTPTGARNLTLTISQAGLASGAQSIAVSVTPENDAPVFSGPTSVSTAENLAAGTTIYTAAATDPEGSPLTWSLAGADAALFQITAAGAVSFRTSPDFEAPRDAGGNNRYDIIVRASDGALTSERAVAVSVTNLADTSFVSGIGPVTITETQAEAGVFVMPDATLRLGDAPILSVANFRILESDPGLRLEFRNTAEVTVLGVNAQARSTTLRLADGTLVTPRIEQGVLQIPLAEFAALAPAQRDAVLRSLVAVNMTDNPALDRTISFDVSENNPIGSFNLRITPVNDPVSIAVVPAAVREGSHGLFALATASDPDTAANSLTWTLSGTDAGLFDVVASGASLSLRFKTAPDFDAPADANGDNIYDVTINISDGQFSAAQSTTVTVTDAIETSLSLLDASRVLTAAQAVSGLQRLDPDVLFISADGALSGGALTVSGLKPSDVVALIHAGDAPGQIGVTGSEVRFGGQVIGTASGGVGDRFRVELHGAAVTPQAVEALIEALGFRTATATPDASRRLLIEFIDADGRRLDPDPGPDLVRLVSRAGGPGEPAGVTPYSMVTTPSGTEPLSGRIGVSFGSTLLDLDGDGRAELLGYFGSEFQLRAFRAATDIWSEQPALAAAFPPAPVGPFSTLHPVDFDADGRLDVVYALSTGPLLAYRNGATGFEPVAPADSPFASVTAASTRRVAFGDLDQDGRADLLVGDGPLTAWRNTPAGFVPFAPGSDPLAAVSVAGLANLALIHLDSDGWIDLVIATGGSLRGFRNVSGQFQPLLGDSAIDRGIIASDFAGFFPAGDLDGDGRQDLLASGSSGAYRAVWGTHGIDVVITGAFDQPPAGPALLDLAPAPEDSAPLIPAATLLAGWVDPEGKPLSLAGVELLTGLGTAKLEAGGLRFTPAPNDSSAMVALLRISDGANEASRVVRLDLTPVNDTPTGAVNLNFDPATGNVAATHTLADVDGLGAVSIQWQSFQGGAWSDIPGAQGVRFSAGPSDLLVPLRPVARYVDGGGTAESVASNQAVLLGTSGADTLASIAARPMLLSGGAGNDTLTGSTARDRLFGGEGDDVLRGESGNDLLVGGAGNDVLTGGGSPDQFRFGGPTDGVDRVTDFVVGVDVVELRGGGFGLRAGALESGAFVAGAVATGAGPQVLYASGVLRFDPDGAGPLAAVTLATFDGSPALGIGSFSVIA